MKLWVDDLRLPPDGSWTWVSTPDIAIWMLKNHPCEHLALDHDLGIQISGDSFGDDLTTRPIVLWLCENPEYWPAEVSTHTQNPVGRSWLEGMVTRYKPGGGNHTGHHLGAR